MKNNQRAVRIAIPAGTRFNRYVVLKDLGMVDGYRKVLAKCSCGVIKTVHWSALKSGETKSCGCYQIEIRGKSSITHNLTKHPLYKIWLAAKSRCTYPKNIGYKHYGGRGITFCKKWMNDFQSFYGWARSAKWERGLQLDRINNNKGYSPQNCRFVRRIDNLRNKRNNRLIMYKGQTKTLSEWAEITGVNIGTIWARLKARKPFSIVFYKGKFTRKGNKVKNTNSIHKNKLT